MALTKKQRVGLWHVGFREVAYQTELPMFTVDNPGDTVLRVFVPHLQRVRKAWRFLGMIGISCRPFDEEYSITASNVGPFGINISNFPAFVSPYEGPEYDSPEQVTHLALIAEYCRGLPRTRLEFSDFFRREDWRGTRTRFFVQNEPRLQEFIQSKFVDQADWRISVN